MIQSGGGLQFLVPQNHSEKEQNNSKNLRPTNQLFHGGELAVWKKYNHNQPFLPTNKVKFCGIKQSVFLFVVKIFMLQMQISNVNENEVTTSRHAACSLFFFSFF